MADDPAPTVGKRQGNTHKHKHPTGPRKRRKQFSHSIKSKHVRGYDDTEEKWASRCCCCRLPRLLSNARPIPRELAAFATVIGSAKTKRESSKSRKGWLLPNVTRQTLLWRWVVSARATKTPALVFCCHREEKRCEKDTPHRDCCCCCSQHINSGAPAGAHNC